MDLQGHVFDVLVIGGQDAQDHVVRVSEEGRGGVCLEPYIKYIYISQTCTCVTAPFLPPQSLLSSAQSPDPCTHTLRDLAASYTPTVMQPCGRAEVRTSSKAVATESILQHGHTPHK